MGRHRLRGRVRDSGGDGSALGHIVRPYRTQAGHYQRADLYDAAVDHVWYVVESIDGSGIACFDRLHERERRHHPHYGCGDCTAA